MQVSSEHKLVGHDGPITKLCWSKCNTLLCSSSEDRSVRLWQLNGVAHCQWIGWGKFAQEGRDASYYYQMLTMLFSHNKVTQQEYGVSSFQLMKNLLFRLEKMGVYEYGMRTMVC